MYTIDKEYLEALKKRINGERETHEKDDASIVCFEGIERNVQNVLSDMVLLEITEKVEDNGQEQLGDIFNIVVIAPTTIT